MSRIKSGRALGWTLVGGALLLGGLGGCAKKLTAPELVADARRLQGQGDSRGAMIQLKNALASQPDDAGARFMLARASLELGDPAAAEKEVRRAIGLGYAAGPGATVLARALLEQGQYPKLLADTEQAAKAADAELLSMRAQALFLTGQTDQAKQLYQAVLRTHPQYSPALVGMAVMATGERDLAAATLWVEQAVKADPKNAEAWMYKGELLRAQNQPEAADAAFDQALAAKPNHRTAYIEKALLAIAARRFDAAEKDLQAAKKAAPNSPIVTYTRALLEFSQGNNAAAQASLLQVLKVMPDHRPSILLAAAVEFNLGSMQQAERHLRAYLEGDPGNPYATRLLAATLLRSSQPADALAVLGPALKQGQADVQLLSLAGNSYMSLGDYGKASGYFQQAATLDPKKAALRTSLGMSEMMKGAPVQGVSDLEAAAALDAKSLPAGLALVRTELDLKHYDKALAAAQRLEQAHPDNAEVTMLKGAAQHGGGDLAAARRSYEAALRLQPAYFLALSNLVRLDLSEGHEAAAVARLKAYADKGQKGVDAMTGLAALATAHGHTAEATSWLEQAAAINPDALEPALRLALQYLGSGQPDQALTLVRKQQAAHPDNTSLLDVLGQAQQAVGKPGEALESFSKLATLAPKAALPQFRVAGAYLQLKNADAAAEALKKALALQPDFVAALLAQADLLQRAGKLDQAIAVVRQVQQLQPSDPLGFMLEGDLLLAQHKPQLAQARYEQAHALSPKLVLKSKIVNAMREAGKGKEAEQRLQAWIVEFPQASFLQIHLAELKLADHDYPAAIPLLQGVLQREPANVGALNNLSWAYLQVKDGRALATAEQAYKLAGDNPGVIDTLGWTLLDQSQVARALPLLQKAASLAPDAGDIHYHLAMGYVKVGDKNQARKELEQLLAKKQPFAQSGAARTLLQQL